MSQSVAFVRLGIVLGLLSTTVAQAQDSALFKGLRYRMVGPNRGGRVTAVTGVSSQPATFYMGVASGGVWKTIDAGQNWFPISDGKIPVASIGAIEVAQSDPNIVYVGTGSDGVRSNVSIGRGVYKSTDAGQTWTFVGLREAGQIGAMRVHPGNPDIVYVSATGNPFKANPERGVFRSRDGGKSWTKVLFVSDSTGAADVELQPGNPNVVFAVMSRIERKPWTIISGAREGGIYRSVDGGDNWTRLTSGLPNGLIGKGNIGVTAANPNRLYLLYEAKPGGGLYRSDDAGATWSMVNGMPAIVQRPFYYTTLSADPTNADVVYVGAEGFWKSTDGGKTLRSFPTPHGDNHEMWINPRDGNLMIQSNDGGANVSVNGGRTWSTQYNQPTAEIYQVYLDNQFPYRLYGAQQDNTTLIVPSLPLNSGQAEEWRTGPGCETGPIMPHPTNPDTVYGSCKGQYSRMSLRTGQEKQYWVGAQSLYGNVPADLIFRFQRVSPMEISPWDPRTIYYGSQFVHRTRDEGVAWEKISPDLTANDPRLARAISGEPITRDMTGEEVYPTLYSIRESPVQRGVIWTGANDGPFHVSRDNGVTWTNITPRDLPPGGRVAMIDPSPHRAGSAYYAVYRYLLGDFAPYIYKTDDFGKTWKRLTTGSNGIPNDVPTRVVREDPDRPGLLYAGTEFGMYISKDDGAHWQSFQLNLPIVPINDIKVYRKDLVIATQGRAFWIVDNLTPLHQGLGKVSLTTGPVTEVRPAYSLQTLSTTLFRPRDAYLVRYQAGGGFGRGRGPAAPQYPPVGAMLDYFLGQTPSTAVTLTVLDSAGGVVRAFSSESGRPPRGADIAAGGMPGAGVGNVAAEEEDGPARARPASPLSTELGLNRYFWDLTYPGPRDGTTGQPAGNGPLAVPGRYTVRLDVAGQTISQPLVVREDPRNVKDGVTLADLREQFEHNIRVRDLVSDANRVVARLREARRRLREAPTNPAVTDTLSRIAAIEEKLLTPPIRYSTPGLQAHITYLYSLTSQAQQKVGRDAKERYVVLRKELDAIIAQTDSVLGK
ncbi:MAG TPA: hypothetical protein VFT29_18760 [Gemmatimonadaceae bacterium]|nr:hypothetical protein [Gemmatimonadaceae bacterium]